MLHHFPVEYGANNKVDPVSTNESHGQFTMRLLTTVLLASLGVPSKIKECDGRIRGRKYDCIVKCGGSVKKVV